MSDRSYCVYPFTVTIRGLEGKVPAAPLSPKSALYNPLSPPSSLASPRSAVEDAEPAATASALYLVVGRVEKHEINVECKVYDEHEARIQAQPDLSWSLLLIAGRDFKAFNLDASDRYFRTIKNALSACVDGVVNVVSESQIFTDTNLKLRRKADMIAHLTRQSQGPPQPYLSLFSSISSAGIDDSKDESYLSANATLGHTTASIYPELLRKRRYLYSSKNVLHSNLQGRKIAQRYGLGVQTTLSKEGDTFEAEKFTWLPANKLIKLMNGSTKVRWYLARGKSQSAVFGFIPKEAKEGDSVSVFVNQLRAAGLYEALRCVPSGGLRLSHIRKYRLAANIDSKEIEQVLSEIEMSDALLDRTAAFEESRIYPGKSPPIDLDPAALLERTRAVERDAFAHFTPVIFPALATRLSYSYP